MVRPPQLFPTGIDDEQGCCGSGSKQCVPYENKPVAEMINCHATEVICKDQQNTVHHRICTAELSELVRREKVRC